MFDERCHKTTIIIVLIISNLIFIGLCLFLYLDVTTEPELQPNRMMMVYITGEVHKPNVYELKDGARLNDLILLAGGLTDDADSSYVNLALKLRDEMRIHIPSLVEEEGRNQKININQAKKEQLMSLKGIGETRARSIIEYREVHGPFIRIEDIMNVSGIGEAIYAGIKDYIRV